jgi:hypothetical protein
MRLMGVGTAVNTMRQSHTGVRKFPTMMWDENTDITSTMLPSYMDGAHTMRIRSPTLISVMDGLQFASKEQHVFAIGRYVELVAQQQATVVPFVPGMVRTFRHSYFQHAAFGDVF